MKKDKRTKEKKKIVDRLNDGRGKSAVRFSFSAENSVEEAEMTVECLKRLVPKLRRFVPR